MPTTPPKTIECYIPVLLPSAAGAPTSQHSTGIVIHAQEEGTGVLVIFGNRSSTTFNDLSMPALLWQAEQNGGQYLQGKLDLSLNRPAVDLRTPSLIQAAFEAANASASNGRVYQDIPGLGDEADRIRRSGVFDKGVRHTIPVFVHKG